MVGTIGCCNYILFEYDKRFEVFGEQFQYFDYHQGIAGLSSNYAHSFDMIAADPAFLSRECFQMVFVLLFSIPMSNDDVMIYG